MSPIDYIDLPNSHLVLSIVLLSLGGALFAVGFILMILSIGPRPLARKLDQFSGIYTVAAWVGLVVIVAGFIANLAGNPSREEHDLRVERIQSSIQDSYGLRLTGDQVQGLNYPAKASERDFEIYGSFEDQKQTEGANFESRKVYLVWADGKLNLSQSTDGESFTELKSKD